MTKTLLSQQIDALLFNESNIIANLSNASALLNDTMEDLNWVGFYLYDDKLDELVLGPFQGKVACMHIKNGEGVCGTALKQGSSLLVPNVHEFAGHIACDSASNSELVVPIFKDGKPFGVLDIDSPSLNRFTKEDQANMEEFVSVLVNHL
ncbi:gaf domain-containing protein [Ligilactobacillus hayakitensis DSM 18933 = JCM 14209]|uniref:Gaf domain-containing protein n=1 Tax=Ligilactobacillus hayakitensis DSM 18933 = JCM 14209 TaxID=1423755 RepID=A0A0R1WVT7_9LACO|nr:GAF domain-containing protein [Ligilactobacillus hayakitensis]KRM19107.1 gaf domain-containing protein [Ligilactobacillus hayakitensis DSM 18933 = JCM 14209]